MNIPKQYLPVMPYLGLKVTDAPTEKVVMAETQLKVSNEKAGIMSGEIKIREALNKLGTALGKWPEKIYVTFLLVEDVERTYKLALENNAKPLKNLQKKANGFVLVLLIALEIIGLLSGLNNLGIKYVF